jgi:pimeloyl-ACP methyl ester carboxylesterase
MAVKMNMQSVKKESRNGTAFLILPDGRQLAYQLSEGRSPGVVFLSGFRSDMTGAKASAMADYCKQAGQRFLRFDYTGHGQSSGDFMDCTIGGWKNDALAMLDHLMPEECILIGSSMGAWIMLLAARERQQQVRGLLGLASAADFTENLVWRAMTP